MTQPPEALPELLADHDTPVPATGAPERDRQIRLALSLVPGNEEREQSIELVEELTRARLGEHVVTHGCVETGEGSQLLDPMRVGKEPAVEHEIDVEREPVLVAECDDVDLQRRV